MWSQLRVIVIASAAICVALLGVARAQEFPTKPIFIVVGPGPDAMARLIAQKMSTDWAQQVLIDNQPGAGGTIAVRNVAKAAPQGYTLLFSTGSYSINEVLRPSLPVKLMRDFEPVVQIASLSFVVLVPSSLPVQTLADLVALARSKPGAINCASPGVGTPPHLGCELLNEVGKVRTIHVPYQGLAPAIVDLISNRVQVTFSVPTTLEYVKSGQLRALAVTGAKRLPTLPDVPTVAEAGFADLQFTSWNGLHAPLHTPKAIIAKLNAEIGKIRDLPDIQQRMKDFGLTPEGGTAAEFGEFVGADISRWNKIVKETGVKIE